MSKLTPSLRPWLEEVEEVEERLETMKAGGWHLPRSISLRPTSVVRATAGLLGKRVPSGKIYQRRLRRSWEQSFRKRLS